MINNFFFWLDYFDGRHLHFLFFYLLFDDSRPDILNVNLHALLRVAVGVFFKAAFLTYEFLLELVDFVYAVLPSSLPQI